MIKKLIRKLKNSFKIFILTLVCKIKNNKIFIVGTPIHGNIGDQAILIAERKFLSDNFKKYKVIELESNFFQANYIRLKKIIKNDLIMVHGGGFLGNLWLQEEEMFRNLINNFKENTIIVFPQTIYFTNDKEGQAEIEKSKKIYYSHRNLYICCRENYSYEFMKDKLPMCNILLIPDMVLYLNPIEEKKIKTGALYCIRKDKEKINYDFSKIDEKIKKYKVDYTDTVIPKNIKPWQSEKLVKRKINEFSKYKIIVTDRLHGMIFALLAKTPCLVYENKSYKVKGVYEWIKNINYIKLFNEKNLNEILNDLFEKKLNLDKYEGIRNEYIDLINLVSSSINRK